MSLNLKQSFKHQNKLSELIDSLTSHLSWSENVSNITELHKKEKVIESKSDETITREKNLKYDTDDVVKTLLTLVDEKCKLTHAINCAKVYTDKDIDGIIASNIIIRKALRPLKVMCSLKETTKIKNGKDYSFNVEGNQMPFIYEIEEISKPDFNQSELKKVVKEYESQLEEDSNMIDEIYVSTKVDYTPIISDNDTLEDVIESITSKK